MYRAVALAAALATAIVVAGCGGPVVPAPAPTPTSAAPAGDVVTAGPDTVAPDAPAPDSGTGQDNAALAGVPPVAVLPPSSDVTGTYQRSCVRPLGASTELPVPSCTPGAVRSDVTEANIRQNICVRGWTSTVRPPQAETGPVKTTAMNAYGVAPSLRGTTELDHKIPLELAGSNDVSNLWPEISDEPGHSFNNKKDQVENDLRAAVCAHKVQLPDAQRAIAANWQTAEHVLGIGP